MQDSDRRGRPDGKPHIGGSRPLGEAPRRFPLAPVGFAVAAVGALALAVLLLLRPAPPASGDPNAALYASIGGPFHMTDQDGRAVDQHVLDGKWSAVFFGYVSCPDVCPATLQTLANAQAMLGADAEHFQVVFVSVDPGRDTPKLLKTYLTEPGFPPHALGLTGTKDQVAAIAKGYKVYYATTPRTAAQGGGYDVNHSGAIYLMDPRGRMVGSLIEAQGPAAMADQIHAAMRGGA